MISLSVYRGLPRTDRLCNQRTKGKVEKNSRNMENFEDLIDKLRPIDAHQIDSFYADKFAVSVLRMLLKLGVK